MWRQISNGHWIVSRPVDDAALTALSRMMEQAEPNMLAAANAAMANYYGAPMEGIGALGSILGSTFGDIL